MPEAQPRRRLARVAAQLAAAPVAAGSGSRFSGQVCIVTGGARGIGRCIAERLSQEGARAVCLFDVGEAFEAVAALKAAGTKAVAKQVELTKEAEVSRAVAEVVQEFGQVDVLVQAAGITGKTNTKTHDVDPADFDHVFAVNVKAIFLCARAVLPSMLKTGYGRIVNIASISGKEGNAGMLAYSSSKAAVIGLTKVMGKDYVNMGKDITVNCVAPAVVQTAMVDAMPPEQVKYMTDKIPMARTGKMAEVASTVCFAASKECSFTTGFCFDASGGRTVY
jgi:3-oxoacyl-[acyl-carrier protein] reductase